MSSSPPSDILPRARKLILPLVGTPSDRQSLLHEAFYSFDNVLHRIKHSDDSYTFATLCITTLLNHGCLTKQEHALARLLTTARPHIGVEQHPEIDNLITLLNEICTGKKSETALTAAPVPDSPPPAPAAVDPVPPVTSSNPTLPPPPNDLPPHQKRPKRMIIGWINVILINIIAFLLLPRLFNQAESVQITVGSFIALEIFLFLLMTERNLKEDSFRLAANYIDHPTTTALCLIVIAGGALFLNRCNEKGCFGSESVSTTQDSALHSATVANTQGPNISIGSNITKTAEQAARYITSLTEAPSIALLITPSRRTCTGQDGDGDGVCDSADACPALYSGTADGCPRGATATHSPQPDPGQASHTPTVVVTFPTESVSNTEIPIPTMGTSIPLIPIARADFDGLSYCAYLFKEGDGVPIYQPADPITGKIADTEIPTVGYLSAYRVGKYVEEVKDAEGTAWIHIQVNTERGTFGTLEEDLLYVDGYIQANAVTTANRNRACDPDNIIPTLFPTLDMDATSLTNDYETLEFYWDKDSFTMYVAGPGIVNLEALTFIAGNEIISPADKSNIPLDAIESPFCIHFYWQELADSSVVSDKCEDITTYPIPYPNRPDVFWLQSNGNRPIIKIDAVVGNIFRESCAFGASWCQPFPPPPPPTDTFTPSPSHTPTDTPTHTPTPTPTPISKYPAAHIDGPEIAAPFWIDVYEVSNERFYGSAEDISDPSKPHTDIPYHEAESFCQAQGGHLPTEEQWQQAAGPHIYPWSDADPIISAEFSHANYDASPSKALVDVDDPHYGIGVSQPYGLWHMAGNAAEWTVSADGNIKIYGGSYQKPKRYLKNDYSENYETQASSDQSQDRTPTIGFRCVYMSQPFH